MRSRAWRWPEPGQLILALVLAAMDAILIYTPARVAELYLARLLPYSWALSPLLLVVLWLVAWIFGRWLLGSAFSEQVGRLFAVLVGALLTTGAIAIAASATIEAALGGTIGSLMAAFALGIALWLRGLAQSTDIITFTSIYNTFRLGVGVVIASAVMAALGTSAEQADLNGLIGPLVLGFFAAGLLGLAVSNLLAGAAEAGAGDRPARLDLRWTLVAAGAVGTVLLAGAIGVAAGLDRLAGALQAGASGLLSLLAVGIYGVIYVISWLLFTLIFNPIGWLISLFRGEPPPPNPNTEISPLAPPDFSREPLGQVPDSFALPLKWFAAFLLLALLVWGVSMVLRRYQSKEQESADVERESLGGWDLLWQQFLAWLRGLFGRNREQTMEATARRGDLLENRADRAEVLSVRRVYAALQSTAAAAGHPRRPGQTPDEYLAELAHHYPGASTELAAITRAYDIARYGPPPLSPALVGETNANWQRVAGVMVKRNA